MNVPIIGFWSVGDLEIRPARRPVFSEVRCELPNRVGIKTISGGLEGAVTLFNPGAKIHPDVLYGEAVHFLEDGSMRFGIAIPKGPGIYDIQDYKPYTAARDARIIYSCKPDQIVF